MIRALTLTGAMMASMTIAGTAAAVDKDGVYINVGATQLSTELDLTNTDVSGEVVDLGVQDTDITMITGRIGYRINDYFAIEGEAGFGFGGDEFSQPVPVDVLGTVLNVDTNIALDVKNYYVGFGRVIYPVSDQIDIFARVGYGQATAEADITANLAGISATGSVEEKADDIAYGVGAQYDFSLNDGIRADYTRLEDTDIISISYARRF